MEALLQVFLTLVADWGWRSASDFGLLTLGKRTPRANLVGSWVHTRNDMDILAKEEMCTPAGSVMSFAQTYCVWAVCKTQLEISGYNFHLFLWYLCQWFCLYLRWKYFEVKVIANTLCTPHLVQSLQVLSKLDAMESNINIQYFSPNRFRYEMLYTLSCYYYFWMAVRNQNYFHV
jgi:hypothetical protein